MKGTKLFLDFLKNEKASGVILIMCTIFSITAMRLPFGASYQNFWNTDIFNHTLQHWINDGLMTLFFLMVGLEIERELIVGELSNLKAAMLPIFAAVGGMLVPAIIYLFITFGTPNAVGFGIPMATDIAFSLAVISLLGKRVPIGLKVFLAALAIIDDLGAIFVIGIFYTQQLNLFFMLLSILVIALLLVVRYFKLNFLWLYLTLGFFLWYTLLNSGVHATLAGVILAFIIPFNKIDGNNMSLRLQKGLHIPVSLFVIPLFVLCNTCIFINPELLNNGLIDSLLSFAVIIGLVIGKPLGIVLFSFIAVKFKFAVLPAQINYKLVLGAGMLAGIGFTMSIFVCNLAFKNIEVINNLKIAILFSAVISSLIGVCYLRFVSNKTSF